MLKCEKINLQLSLNLFVFVPTVFASTAQHADKIMSYYISCVIAG
jgi:hypothetical protein